VAQARHISRAEGLIRAAGERLTAPRAAVLALLLGADRALTHHEIGAGLAARVAVDRVTVYRVLDWLVATGLAHRIAGDDRTWRFRASLEGTHARHAHFTCSACGKTECLDQVRVRAPARVPAGYLPREVELTIRGLCAGCH